MSKKASPTLIGGFVVGALVIVLAALMLFGSGRFFAEKRRAVIYFKESVAGLSVGASVNFNGVTVGTVEAIELVYDVKERSAQIPVFIQLFPDNLAVIGGDRAEVDIQSLVAQGMRAQLGINSVITQQLVINLVMAPNSRIRLVEADPDTFRTPKGIIELPAIPSQMQELKAAIEKVVKNLADLDVDQLVQQIKATVAGIENLVNNADVQEFLQQANATMEGLLQLIQKVDQEIGPLLATAQDSLEAVEGAADAGERTLTEARQALSQVTPVLSEAQQAMRQLQRTLASAGSVIEPSSPLYGQALAALKEAASAARSVRALANQLERNPNSILFGRRR